MPIRRSSRLKTQQLGIREDESRGLHIGETKPRSVVCAPKRMRPREEALRGKIAPENLDFEVQKKNEKEISPHF